MTEPRPTDTEFTRTAFESLGAVSPSPDLARLVAQIPLTHPRSGARGWWPFESFFLPAFSLGCALLLGVGFDRILESTPAESGEDVANSSAKIATRTDPEDDSASAELSVSNSESNAELDELLALATLDDFETGDYWLEPSLSAEESN